MYATDGRTYMRICVYTLLAVAHQPQLIIVCDLISLNDGVPFINLVTFKFCWWHRQKVYPDIYLSPIADIQ